MRCRRHGRIQSDQASAKERLSAALVPMNDGETLTVSEPRTDSGPRPVVAQPTPVLVATEPEPTTAAISTAPTPLPRYQPAVARVELTGFNHQWQTWNNCGPATLSMNLSYFGNPLTQADIGAVLRRHEDDKNVSPEELVDFARSQGYHAQLRVNGNRDLMRLLLSNGVPVIVETWLEEHPNDGMGHYRMLTGYDDAEQYWIAYDSYVDTGLFSSLRSYAGIRMEYAETEALWSVFNHTYLLIYTDALAPIVESIYGEKLDQSLMWQQALASAQQSVQAQPNNAYAWFNLGTDLTQLGDYAGAAQAYDRARQIGLPWRMLWYQFGPFEAYHAVGRYQDVVALADATLRNTQSIEELHYWRAQGLMGLGNIDAARQAFQQALRLNPDYQPAQSAIAGL
ncbi:MAG: tetratricopeptide repeat protein [Caldilineaceae bacterium]